MIEAYEGLRGRLTDSGVRQEEIRPVEMMFDVWLRALHSIHESMAGDARNSNSGCGALEAGGLG